MRLCSRAANDPSWGAHLLSPWQGPCRRDTAATSQPGTNLPAGDGQQHLSNQGLLWVQLIYHHFLINCFHMRFIPKIAFQRVLGWVVWHIGFFVPLINGSVVLTQQKPQRKPKEVGGSDSQKCAITVNYF